MLFVMNVCYIMIELVIGSILQINIVLMQISANDWNDEI